ncbi:MAG: CPBP family intramembrane glutamic endopeptidase [Chloroflexota bacterium]
MATWIGGSRTRLGALFLVPIVGLAIAERAVMSSNALAAALFGTVLLWLLLSPILFGAGATQSIRDLSWVLATVPAVRLMSLTMPVDRLSPLLAWIAVAMITVITVFSAARKLGYSSADIGLSWHWMQVGLLAIGVAAGAAYGLLVYDAVRPRPLIGDLTLRDAWLPSLVLVYLVGIAEELLFRGLVQRAAVNAFGRVAGIALPALVFATLYAGSPSLGPILLALVAGCALGWLAQAGRSIIAPIATRSAMVVTTFVVAPYVVPVATVPPPIPEPVASDLQATPVLHIPPVGGPQTRRGLTPAAGTNATPTAPPPTATPAPASSGTPAALAPPPTPRPTPLLAPRPIVAVAAVSIAPRSEGGSRLAQVDATGGIAVSDDRGRTWQTIPAPEHEPVLRIIPSIFNRDELHALTASGYFVSVDDGKGWLAVRRADPGERFVDIALSGARNVIAAESPRAPLQIAETGEPFTIPELDPPVDAMIAVVPHPREDRVFAVDSRGRTFLSELDDPLRLSEGTPLPEGLQPAERGLRVTDSSPSSLLILGKDGAIWQDSDGFVSRDAYVRVQ